MTTPRFSIIVPVYNTEAFLSACVESVLRQGGSDYELLLADDGSTDGCGALCDNYAQRCAPAVRTIHWPNAGLLMTRRRALAEARGEYVLFLDSDDCLAEGALDALRAILLREEPDIILYRWLRIDENGSPTDDVSEHLFPEGPISRTRVLSRAAETEALNSLCLKLIRRTLFDTDADYAPCAAVTNGEDLLQSLPVIQAAERFYYTSSALYLYRLNSASITNASRKGNYLYLKLVRQRLLDVLEAEGLATDASLLAFFRVSCSRLLALMNAAASASEDGIEPMLRSLLDCPVVYRMRPYVLRFSMSLYLRLTVSAYLRGHLRLSLLMLRFRSAVFRLLDALRGGGA